MLDFVVLVMFNMSDKLNEFNFGQSMKTDGAMERRMLIKPRIVHRRCDSIDHSSRKSTSDESKLSLDTSSTQTPPSSPLVIQKPVKYGLKTLGDQIDLDEVTRQSHDYEVRLSVSSASERPKPAQIDDFSRFKSVLDSNIYTIQDLDFPFDASRSPTESYDFPHTISKNIPLREMLKSPETPDSATLSTNNSLLTCRSDQSDDFHLPDSSLRLLEKFNNKTKRQVLSKTVERLRQKI